MTSEVSTVGHPHTLVWVNGSFVNDTKDMAEPSLPSHLVTQRRFQFEGPTLCQLDQFPCELLGTDRKWWECCMASSSAMNVPPTLGTAALWNGAGSARLDERWLTLAPHHTGAKQTHPQPSPEPGAQMCASSGPLPLTPCRAKGWMKHKHWVGAPLLHQLFEGRSFTGTWFYSLKISTSRADTTHMSFGGLYIMKTNQQNTALFQFRIWSQELCPFLLADWKFISLEKC